MWLYLPTSCRSAQAEEVSTSGSDSLFQALERSATWKTKSRPAASWRRTWRTAVWTTRLFGQTYEPSTAQRGAEQWIRSLGVTPVSRSATQASASAPTIHVTSGPTSPGSWQQLSLDGASSRTSVLICDSEATRSSESFKAWATALRRHCLQRRKSARLMAANGSSFWPTARASYNENRTTKDAPSHGVTHGATLAGTAAGWPTPTSTDAKASGAQGYSSPGHHDGTTLTDRAQRNWQTPNAAAEAPNLGSNIKNGPKSLLEQAARVAAPSSMWKTPTASEDAAGRPGANMQQMLKQQTEEWATGLPAQRMMQAGDESSPSDRTSRRRLNPAFVTWLMGWPSGWLDLTSSTSSETA